ncbi:hypothetical protein BDV23DRAFT_160232 [Aspergillus alliaceus]|uniref:Uncharacterized protein n=1 Tax=Petromyces alliaceus TaxID=209559 RepID=A0A5N7C1H6_PETAA|nr:hypothetical protein BDV23DRAFT_160232 [Aspergillus alliaceus]
MKTKRRRLSRGGRWTEDERRRLWRLRTLNEHLNWDQFQRLYFPERSYMALTKAYSDMRMRRYATMNSNVSNGTTLPSKTSRSNKRPNADGPSVNERASKQTKTAEKDSAYIPDGDSDETDLETEVMDYQFDGRVTVSDLVKGPTRSSADSAATNQPQKNGRVPVPQWPKNGTSLGAGASNKTTAQPPEPPGRAGPSGKSRGTEKALGPVIASRPVPAATSAQSTLQPRVNHGALPSKGSEPSQGSMQIRSPASDTVHGTIPSLVEPISDHKHDPVPKNPKMPRTKILKETLRELLLEADSYQSERLINEKHTEELKELRSQNATQKNHIEILEAELSEARSNLSQQSKSGQPSKCEDCPRLREQITALEKDKECYEFVKKHFISGLEGK